MSKFLALVFLAIFTLSFPRDTLAIGNGSISLTPSISAQPGSIIETPVMINTDGEPTAGVDAILTFDKNILELVDITVYPENSNNAFSQFLTANFNLTPQDTSEVQLISQANTQGIFSFSGITGVFTPFNGVLGENNPLARIKFKVLTNAPTSVNFQFTPNSTTDTNMVSTDGERDLLKTVTNMSVNNNLPITYPEASAGSKLGDLNGDDAVDIFDYTIVLTDFGKTGSNIQGDVDKSGGVDIFDYTTLLTNFAL